MKRFILFILVLPILAIANTEHENEKLAQASRALNHVKEILKEAESYQEKGTAIEFQYKSIVSDINKIQEGIHEKFTPETLEPRIPESISGDYVEYRSKSYES